MYTNLFFIIQVNENGEVVLDLSALDKTTFYKLRTFVDKHANYGKPRKTSRSKYTEEEENKKISELEKKLKELDSVKTQNGKYIYLNLIS